MLYGMLYAAGDGSKRDRRWMVRFIRDATQGQDVSNFTCTWWARTDLCGIGLAHFAKTAYFCIARDNLRVHRRASSAKTCPGGASRQPSSRNMATYIVDPQAMASIVKVPSATYQLVDREGLLPWLSMQMRTLAARPQTHRQDLPQTTEISKRIIVNLVHRERQDSSAASIDQPAIQSTKLRRWVAEMEGLLYAACDLSGESWHGTVWFSAKVESMRPPPQIWTTSSNLQSVRCAWHCVQACPPHPTYTALSWDDFGPSISTWTRVGPPLIAVGSRRWRRYSGVGWKCRPTPRPWLRCVNATSGSRHAFSSAPAR